MPGSLLWLVPLDDSTLPPPLVVPVVVVAYKAVVEYVREVADMAEMAGHMAVEHEVDNLVETEAVVLFWAAAAAVAGDCNVVDCGYRFPDWNSPVCQHVPSSKTFAELVLLDGDDPSPEIEKHKLQQHHIIRNFSTLPACDYVVAHEHRAGIVVGHSEERDVVAGHNEDYIAVVGSCNGLQEEEEHVVDTVAVVEAAMLVVGCNTVVAECLEELEPPVEAVMDGMPTVEESVDVADKAVELVVAVVVVVSCLSVGRQHW